MSTELIPATSVTHLVGVFRDADLKLRQAFNLVNEAEESLNTAFGQERGWGFDMRHLMSGSYGRGCAVNFKEYEQLAERMKIQAWRVLVQRMELRRYMSVARAKELDKQLETGEGLPEIQEDLILGLMQGTLGKINEYLEEAVLEVYEILRPNRNRENGGYKTNGAYEVERKVIMEWWVSPSYSNDHPFKISRHRDAEVTAVDNVFHKLDGKGLVGTHYGPLHDSVRKAGRDGRFDTEYFKGRCFKNGNLHLEFKREDLLAELNRVAGGARLKPRN